MRTRAPARVRIVVSMARLQRGDRVLEVGCGEGDGVLLAARRVGAQQVAAVDPARRLVDLVRARVPGADVRHGDAGDVPFEDGSFSVVFSVASMHHWPDRERGLASLAAQLAPGGRLLIAERALASRGHGITPGEVEEVLATLARLGLVAPRAERVRAGRTPMTVVLAAAPGPAQPPSWTRSRRASWASRWL